MDSCFISTCKFGSFKNPFTTTTSMSELFFRFRRFILLVQKKKSDFYELWQQHKQLKNIKMTEACPDTFDERFSYFNLTPLTKFTGSSRSTEFTYILSWNIPKMIMKTIPIITRIVISYEMKQGIPLWIWWKVNGNWDINMIKIFQLKESICRTNTSIRTRSGIQVVELTIWVRLFQIEILHQIYQFYQNR